MVVVLYALDITQWERVKFEGVPHRNWNLLTSSLGE